MRIASEGLPLVLTSFLVACLTIITALARLGLTVLIIGLAVSGLGLVFLWFFRDPRRDTPLEAAIAVSPADGRIIETNRLSDGRWHLAIFLSLFDVHVNRVPVSGQIRSVRRQRGSYLPAFMARAAERNARVDVVNETPYGNVMWRQVSGLIARRISCRLRPDDDVKRGDRFGLIYFGSRMDVYLPADSEFTVSIGDRVAAGETIIGRLGIGMKD